MGLNCHLCNKSFTQRRSLIRHVKNYHDGFFDCPNCNQTFKGYNNFLLHLKTCNHNQRKILHDQDDSEGSPSKKRKDTSSIPVQIDQASDDVLVNYNVDLTKFEEGGDF